MSIEESIMSIFGRTFASNVEMSQFINTKSPEEITDFMAALAQKSEQAFVHILSIMDSEHAGIFFNSAPSADICMKFMIKLVEIKKAKENAERAARKQTKAKSKTQSPYSPASGPIHWK